MISFEIKNENEKTILNVAGRIDSSTAPEFQSKIDSIIRETSDLEINLEKLDYVSSAGLRIFLSTQKKINEKSGKLLISNVSQNVREVFEVTGFTEFLTIL